MLSCFLLFGSKVASAEKGVEMQQVAGRGRGRQGLFELSGGMQVGPGWGQVLPLYSNIVTAAMIILTGSLKNLWC